MSLNKCILLLSVASFATLNAFTLDEALQSAININPEIIEKEKRYEEIYYDVKIAKSGYFPKIDLVGTSPLHDSRKKQTRR